MKPKLRAVQRPRKTKGVPFKNICSGLRYFIFLEGKKWALHSRITYESDGYYYLPYQPLGAGISPGRFQSEESVGNEKDTWVSMCLTLVLKITTGSYFILVFLSTRSSWCCQAAKDK